MKNYYSIGLELPKNKLENLNWNPFEHKVLIVMDEISKRILNFIENQRQIENATPDFFGFSDLNNEKNLQKNSEIFVDLEEDKNWYSLNIDIDSNNIKNLSKSIINPETLETREKIRTKILEIFNLKNSSENLNFAF